MDTQQFLDLCRSWDSSSQQFKEIVQSASQVLGVYRKEVAAEFEVAESTVSRWASGAAKPHPIIQKQIIASLEKRARKMLRGREVILTVEAPSPKEISRHVTGALRK
jgi:ribosome-binding protein aMBF1 (putative translation factor)